jgi:tetratricopeptide (TPR) repeat protein
MRFALVAPSMRRSVGVLLLIFAGCGARAHLGKDEGRAAVVWEHPSLAGEAEPVVSPDTEQALVAGVRNAERKTDDPLSLAGALYDLAILRRRQGVNGEAEQLYRRALEIREREQGPDHADVAVILNNLGVLMATEGNVEGAQPVLERALAIRERALGGDDVLTAQSLCNLALLYSARGNADAAEPLYRRSVSILEKAGSDRSRASDLERVLGNYAMLLRDNGRDAEAEQLEARARTLGSTSGEQQPSDQH